MCSDGVRFVIVLSCRLMQIDVGLVLECIASLAYPLPVPACRPPQLLSLQSRFSSHHLHQVHVAVTFIPIIDRNYAARFVSMPVRIDLASCPVPGLTNTHILTVRVFVFWLVSLSDGRALRRLQGGEKQA